MVAVEKMDIRRNPMVRSTDSLEKVSGTVTQLSAIRLLKNVAAFARTRAGSL